MADKCHILVIGAGMIGVSIAARLARKDASVWVIEQGGHSPFSATDCALAPWDPAWVQDRDTAALAWASASLWEEIGKVVEPKGMLHMFSGDWVAPYPDMLARGVAKGSGVEKLTPARLIDRFPWLKAGASQCAMALYVPPGAAGTIDVRRLYSWFRSELYRLGGKIRLNERLEGASYGGGAWTVRTNKREIRADIIVNCAGAFADDVAKRCGARRMGLHSTRRALLGLPTERSSDWAWANAPFSVWHRQSADFLCDVRKNGWVWISPALETTWNMEDSGGEMWAEGWEIAAAIDQFEEWTNLKLVEEAGASPAWLRTFTADRRPVIGWARETPAFYWGAGFGATGVECSLAVSAIASDMIGNRSESAAMVERYGIRMERFSPDRQAFAGVTA